METRQRRGISKGLGYQQVSISRTFLSALLILYVWYQRFLIEAATLDIAEVPADTVDHTHQGSLHFRHPWREDVVNRCLAYITESAPLRSPRSMPAVLDRKPVALAPQSLLAVCSSRGDRNENDQTVVQRLLTPPSPASTLATPLPPPPH